MASGRRNRANNNPNGMPVENTAAFMQDFRNMAQAVREQAVATNRMMETLGRQMGQGNDNGNGHERLMFSEFQKASPPRFRGTVNPDKAEEWMQTIEKIFSVLDCSNQQKVTFAAFVLDADANSWWVGTQRLLEGVGIEITWEVFKEAFYKKYFPVSVRNAKELEFLRLQQGNMTVPEYTAKFEELCKFSTIYQQNPNEEWKCVKYEGGLRENILMTVGPMEIRDFPTLVNKSTLVEEYGKKLTMSRAKQYDNRRNFAPQGPRFKPTLPPRRDFPHGNGKGKQLQRPITNKECPKCGKHHGDKPCLFGQNVCYRCRKPGHMSGECPTRDLPPFSRPQQ